jgi:hypothetical protein
MKTEKCAIVKRAALFVLLVSTLHPPFSTALAQPSLMSYQGRLFDGTNLANGSYDFTFTYFLPPTGGSPLFGPVTNSAVSVSNGLFTTYINTTGINPSLFSGGVAAAHYLEVAARTNGSSGAFSVLTPRQPITTAPSAFYATSAATAGTATTANTANGVAASAVTAGGIASGQVVKSLNGLEDAVTLAQGPNVTITTNGNTLTIAGAGSGGGPGQACCCPGTPITSAPYTISQSGSYYLSNNISVSSGNAITISANNVTLDLNGFTISSTAASATGAAILLDAVTNVAIYNGHISSGVTNSYAGVFGGGGFVEGIYYTGATYNVRVKGVSVAGVMFYGIYLGFDYSTVVESCAVAVAGFDGITAGSVSDSTAVNCGDHGIYADTAHNCKGYGVGSGDGLYAIAANNCYGNSAGNGDGLYATTANNCYGYSSGGYGLYATAVATGCYGYSESGTGLYAFIASVCHADTSTGTALFATHNVNSY